MGKRRFFYLILIFLLILNLLACSNKNRTLITEDYNNIDIGKVNNYRIGVDFQASSKSYTASQLTSYTNNTGVDLNEIYFHLYPLAYSSPDTAPILFANEVIKEDYIRSEMEIKDLKVNKKDVVYEIGGLTNSILRIKLANPLAPGEGLEISMDYYVKLPENIDRFGFGQGIFNFGNWYPVLAVYDEKGWNLDPYYSLGDPFYSDIANYQVEITLPKDMILASSGNILAEKTRKDRKTYKIEGKLLRDLAWVASPDFIVSQVRAGDTEVKLYSLNLDGEIEKFALDVGREAIEIFNRIFGTYPYGQYSIVMTEFPTGMEYPGLVFIGKDYFQEEFKSSLETVIVHETAHQWWYGLVGNDQIDEPWLDESLATYSEVIYMEERYGEEAGRDYYNYQIQTPYEFGKDLLDHDGRVVKPLGEFTGWDDYGLLAYNKGAIFLGEIRKAFGRETLYRILNKYYSSYKFHIARTEDFLRICKEEAGGDIGDKLEHWLYGK